MRIYTIEKQLFLLLQNIEVQYNSSVVGTRSIKYN